MKVIDSQNKLKYNLFNQILLNQFSQSACIDHELFKSTFLSQLEYQIYKFLVFEMSIESKDVLMPQTVHYFNLLSQLILHPQIYHHFFVQFFQGIQTTTQSISELSHIPKGSLTQHPYKLKVIKVGLSLESCLHCWCQEQYSFFDIIKHLIQYLNIQMAKHTFNRKPSCFQLLAYFIFAITNLLFYYSLIPYLAYSKITLFILFTALSVILFLTTLASSIIDPTDFQQQKKSNKFYCEECNKFVKQSSKHCRVCEQCVQNFDHHCKWINNCVGSANYKWFIGMITSVLVFFLTYMAGGISAAFQSKQIQIKLIIGWSWAGLIFIFAVLDLYLLLFHIWLNKNGISTYDYIQLDKAKNSSRKSIQSVQQSQQQKAAAPDKIPKIFPYETSIDNMDITF